MANNLIETKKLKQIMYGCFRVFSGKNLLTEDGLINELPNAVAWLVQTELIKKEQFQEAMYYFLNCYNFGCSPKMTDEYMRTTLTNGILQRCKGIQLLKGSEYIDQAFELIPSEGTSAANWELDKIYSLNFINKYLFFDTETTGLPKNWKAPVSDLSNWPRLVQLAYLYYDKNGNKISSGDFIIKPEGFTIPTDATRIHGISTERALREGESLITVLQKFQTLMDQSEVLVAHNMSFDEKILGAEFLRVGAKDLLPPKTKICTMQSSTNFCAINGPYGYKFPTLSELHYKLFRTGFNEAHNAAVDIAATAKCFWELKRIGKI